MAPQLHGIESKVMVVVIHNHACNGKIKVCSWGRDTSIFKNQAFPF